MNMTTHLETAWRNTLAFLGPLLLLTVVQIVVVLLSLGILAPVTTAGYIQALLRTLREGRPPEIRDLFSTMALFLPLAGFFLLVTIATMIGLMFLVLPGFLVGFGVVFASMYMIPLMTDRGMGLGDALRHSWALATTRPVTDQVVVSLLYLIVISVGASIPFAILVAQPFATLFVLAVYRHRLGDTPGQSGDSSDPGAAPSPPPLPPGRE